METWWVTTTDHTTPYAATWVTTAGTGVDEASYRLGVRQWLVAKMRARIAASAAIAEAQRIVGGE